MPKQPSVGMNLLLQPTKKKRPVTRIVLVLILLSTIFGGGWFLLNQQNTTTQDQTGNTPMQDTNQVPTQNESENLGENEWIWSQSRTEMNDTFIVPLSGTYNIVTTNISGAQENITVMLSAGTEIHIGRTDTILSFGNCSLDLDPTGSTDPSILLSLVEAGLVIEEQPSQQILAEPDMPVTLTVRASTNGSSIGYQWYITSTPDMADMQPIPDATQPQLEFTPNAAQHGYYLFCTVSDETGSKQTALSQLVLCSRPTESPVVYLDGNNNLLDIEANDVWMTHLPTFKAELTETCTVSGLGIPLLRVSTDGGATWQDAENGSIAVNPPAGMEGTITFIAEAYNSEWPSLCAQTVLTVKIDTAAPQVRVEGLSGGEDWAVADKVITVVAQDNGIGLPETPYSWDGGSTWVAANTLNIHENGTVELCVRDAAGNMWRDTISVSTLDKTSPLITISGNPETWTSGGCTLIAEVSDDVSGLAADRPYSWDGGTTWTNDAQLYVAENTVVSFAVRDSAGNVSYQDIEVTKLDSELPVAAYNAPPETWSNEAFLLVVHAGDAVSGLPDTPFSWDGGLTWVSTSEQQVSGNGNITLLVRDNAGNIYSETITVSTLDYDAPGEFTIFGASETGWAKEGLILSVPDAYDSGSGLAAEAYSWNGGDWTSDNCFTVTNNGTVTVSVRDKAGNVRKKELTIHAVDNKAPVIEELKVISKDGHIAVIVVASDEGAGLAEKAYSFDDGVTWHESGEHIVQSGQIVGLKVRDAAGNITYQPFIVG